MPSGTRNPSKAIGHFLRRRREELGLSLRDIQKRTQKEGQLIPFTTLAKIEQGKLDPSIRRLALLLRLYKIPNHLMWDLLDLEEVAAEIPAETDPGLLAKTGLEHWRRGDLTQALAHLFALREKIPSDPADRLPRQKALLSFAIMAASLGKYRLSRQLLDDLLIEIPDPSLIVSVLVQAGRVWGGLGSTEMAMALLDRAGRHVADDDHKGMAWVHHGRTKVLILAGQTDEAETELGKALREYRKANDPYGACLALGLQSKIFHAREDAAGALKASRKAIRAAERHGFSGLVPHRRLEEARALIALGKTENGLEILQEVLSQAVSGKDRELEFYAHYHLWKASEASGDLERARMEREAALYYSRFIDEASEEADEVRKLANS